MVALSVAAACSFESTDADRLVECAQSQAQGGTGTATCPPGFSAPYTGVLVPESGLTGATAAELTADQREYLRQRARNGATTAMLFVFRADGVGSGAEYVERYFEVERPFAKKKGAGEDTLIVIRAGTSRPLIAGIE